MNWSIPYHRALMSEGNPTKQLPRLVEPRKMAHFGALFQGQLSSESLERLSQAVEEILYVSANLTFGVDDQGRKMLTGKVSGEVAIVCQRCMEPLKYVLDANLNLAIVWDEEHAKSLSKDVEPWIVEEPEGDLYAILEEELLLALPTVAYHDYACIDEGLLSFGDSVEGEPKSSDNPFTVLAKLKKKQPNE